MADLTFTILGDLKKLKSDVSNLFKDKFKIDVSGTGEGAATGAGKQGKKRSRMLAKGIGIIAGILALLKTVQPLLDAGKLFLSIIMLAIFKLVKFFMTGGFKNLINTVWTKIVEWLKIGWEFLKALPGKIWEFLKTLPAKIWGFIKGLGTIIWNFIKAGFGWIIEKLIVVKDKLVAWLTNIWNTLKEWFGIVVDKLVEWLSPILDWVKRVWSKIKELAGLIWEKIKVGFQWIKDKVTDVWNAIKNLPGKIWEKLKDLGKVIAEAVKAILPFGGGADDVVKDAIITKNGKVIKTNPNDTIVATQNPNSLGGGGKTINMFGVTPQEMIDTIRREFREDLNQAGRF